VSCSPVTPPPEFVADLPLARHAWAYADEAHGGQTRKSDGRPFIVHPEEVAELLHAAGCADPVIAAGLLHDVIERTPVTAEELDDRFGPRVAGLVAAVTDDPTIDSYRERKAALRRRATESGPDAAVVFAADKISKVRQYRAQLAGAGGGESPRPRRLHHYSESLRLLEISIPGHPLVRQLRRELGDLGSVPRPAAVGSA
jgi:(p)ppGpp synthase/HD superfamily hydrolase